jgi:hypothetical protein
LLSLLHVNQADGLMTPAPQLDHLCTPASGWMHNQVATAGCTYQCGCKGTLNSTDRKPCPLLPVLLLLSRQLLLVQRQQPLSSPPFVLGFFICTTLPRLELLLTNGPSELLRRQTCNKQHQQRWKLTHHDLDSQGIPTWEANVRSEVDLCQLCPRFEYMTRHCTDNSQRSSSSGSSGGSSRASSPDADTTDARDDLEWAYLQQHEVAFRVAIKPAGDKGLGLFAEQLIPKGGHYIGPYAGKVCSAIGQVSRCTVPHSTV